MKLSTMDMISILEGTTLTIYNVLHVYAANINLSKSSAKITHFFTEGGGGLFATRHSNHFSSVAPKRTVGSCH